MLPQVSSAGRAPGVSVRLSCGLCPSPSALRLWWALSWWSTLPSPVSSHPASHSGQRQSFPVRNWEINLVGDDQDFKNGLN